MTNASNPTEIAPEDLAAAEPAADSAPGTSATEPGQAAPTTRRSAATDPESLEREGEIAADYLEELLDIADLDGDIDMDVERDRAVVSVVGGDLDHLVGRDGVVLEAIQELTRLAVLTELGQSTAKTVQESGEPARLEPMSPFERKIVHDAVAAAGLRSESEGEEPHRYVVVLPA
jgi:spoIIIJ-associated protein